MATDNATVDVEQDLELQAMARVYGALKDLDSDAQNRVLDYVLKRLSLSRRDFTQTDSVTSSRSRTQSDSAGQDEPALDGHDEEGGAEGDAPEGLEGVSSVAQKWMRRSGLNANQLSTLFSLGVDEIDLVANTVPGASKKDKVRNVALLLGVASYLGSGAPRFQHDKLKEAAAHYDAYDVSNFASYMKGIIAEVSGSKAAGYTLTARGMNSAKELIKSMTSGT